MLISVTFEWATRKEGGFVASKRVYTKEQRITKEYKRLLKLYIGMDENRLRVLDSLFQQAAFLSVTLEDLRAEINTHGHSEEYQHGKNQKGTKQSTATKTLLAMTKQHSDILRQLSTHLPATKKKDSRLEILANL